jgi:hypothetical protein
MDDESRVKAQKEVYLAMKNTFLSVSQADINSAQ